MPSRAPELMGGVMIILSFTAKIFSAVPSTTLPCRLSMIASSYPALIASTLANAEFA
jgi:hypothetical protein